MPVRPLLILPNRGGIIPRQKRTSGGGKHHWPTPIRQAERLLPQFQRLQVALDARRMKLQADSLDVVPEEVVVLEIIGTVDDFIRAVERIPGMEWLAEVEEEEIPADDDFFLMDENDERLFDKEVLRGRVFMVFSNKAALDQMLSLWNVWHVGQDLPRLLGRFKTLFQRLRNVRRWDVQDRLLETGLLEDWRERMEHGQETVPCEIELWYRKQAEDRSEARRRVAELIALMEGQIINESDIEEIAYHAILARLPINQVDQLFESLDADVELVKCEHIQFMRACGQMSTSLPDDHQEPDLVRIPVSEAKGSPVVALLDGLPLQAHQRLQGRLVVDDPDNFEANYEASARRHGTAMASLILHGDLDSSDDVLPRPLYVRPILQQDRDDWRNNSESVPESVLVVDLVHRAVHRIFERDGEEPPAAEDVAVINISIAILDRSFDQSLSPLARLLDWLAWRYGVLFIVSSGNYTQTISYSDKDSIGEEQLIRAIAADARNRRLRSPSEAINALTIAAIHENESDSPPLAGWTDPYTTTGLPSPINAQGMGYRRGIKPDLLAPGGRVAVRRSNVLGGPADRLETHVQTSPPGQRVASPGTNLGEQDATCYTRGTSNAAAMVSRACGWLYELLDELCEEPSGELIDSIPRSVWLKTIVAHSSEWGLAGSALTDILKNDQNRSEFREYITRLIGYGTINLDRVLECTEQRVTILSAGTLSRDESSIHNFPLPPSLSGLSGHRRLTITLGWLTPVNPRHQGWRRAGLWFSPPKEPLRIKRLQADGQAVLRGTVQHEILEGNAASSFLGSDSLNIQVNCRADAGTLEDAVPYALATTLEVPEELIFDIYEEVRLKLRAPIRPETSI